MSTSAGLTGSSLGSAGDDERKYGPVAQAPFTESTPYWEEKARVCKIVASHPEGVYLSGVLGELYGDERADSGSAAYQRVRRFMASHPQYFRVSDPDGLKFAQPTLDLLDLINGGIIQNPEESGQHGGSDFCADVLKSVKQINDKGERLLEFNLQEYVERINDLRIVLHSEAADPSYITMPYKTRFNDEGRINKQWSIMSSCIEKAGEWFDNAALLTLTTDPKKFSSLYDMVDNINDSWNRMMSWLSSDAHLGYRPEYLKVLEFTEKGYPHLHALVFLEDDSTRADGMPWLESKAAISNYWDKYQGSVVDVQPLRWVDDLGDAYDAEAGWVRWQADGDHGGSLSHEPGDGDGKQTAGAYLGKYLSAVYGGIKQMQGPQVMTDGGEPVEEVSEKYAEKAATWKLGMYWATGRKIRTESRELRQAVEEEMQEEQDDDLGGEVAEIVRDHEYEFVGAYPRGAIPQHVGAGAVEIDALLEATDFESPQVTSSGIDPPSRQEAFIRKAPAKAKPMLKGLLGSED